MTKPAPNDDHVFDGLREGDRPGEGRIACSCGWRSESAPNFQVDLDVHFAEVNGISYEEQKQRTDAALRKLGIWPSRTSHN